MGPLLSPSGRTLGLGSTQLLTEKEGIRGKGGRCVGLTILPPSCTNCLEILEASTSRDFLIHISNLTTQKLFNVEWQGKDNGVLKQGTSIEEYFELR